MGGWVRHEPVAEPAGDVMGGQVSQAWGASWSRPLSGPLHAVVSRTFLAVDEPGGAPGLHRVDTFVACTDPARPADTEEWSDDRHTDVPGPPDSEGAHAAAMAAQAPTDFEWNDAAPMWCNTHAVRTVEPLDHATNNDIDEP